MSEKTLSVFTPAFNRAHTLPRTYESLRRQTCDDFVWVIIDDGSSDGTGALVAGWLEADNGFEIRYFFKENGGMHTAHNRAYEVIDTELNVCIDSDDWLTDDAVERIVGLWKKEKAADFGGRKIAGIIAEDISDDGKLIGSHIPEGIYDSTVSGLYGKLGATGDKKMIYRTDLIKENPYPVFGNEKFYPSDYKYRLLDLEYSMLLLPHPVCVVKYGDDSMSFDKHRQYRTCAKGFAHYRSEMMRISKDPRFLLRSATHYIAESKFAKNKHWIRSCSRPGYVIAALPAGLALYIYLQPKKKK